MAIKIQYPGVKDAVDSDLANLKRIMTLTNAVPKTMYLDKLIHNTRIELYEECEYLKEAEKQSRYSELVKGDERFAVP